MSRQLMCLAHVPPRITVFYLRCLARAVAIRDQWTLDAVTRPRELSILLRAARGCGLVVESGTGTAWTSCALALAEPGRRVITLDPEVHEERERYLALLSDETRSRIRLVQAGGEEGPGALADARPAKVDALFVDGDHSRDGTAAAFKAWRDVLAPGAVVAFHDYNDPDHPDITEAVDELGLEGEARGRLFVCRV